MKQLRPWLIGLVAIGGSVCGVAAGVLLQKMSQSPADSNDTEVASNEDASLGEANPFDRVQGQTGLASRNKPDPGLTFEVTKPEQLQTALDRIDQHLFEENPAGALDILNELLRRGLQDDRLLLRRAVCNEELSNFEDALVDYRELWGSTEHPALRDAARISQARVLIKTGEVDTAMVMLARFLSRSDQSMSTLVTAEATHLFAGVLLDDAEKSRIVTSIEDETIKTDWRPSVRRVLHSVESRPIEDELADEAETPMPGLNVLSEFGRGAEAFQLSLRQSNQPALQLLEEAHEATELTIEVSPSAVSLLKPRRITIDRGNISFATLLDLITFPYGLIWRMSDEAIQIVAVDEVPKPELATLRREIAIRVLRDALSTWPSHELAPVTWMGVANLQAQSGETDAAVALYAQFLREFPKTPLSAPVWFNKAQLEWKLAQKNEALESLYMVVDGFAGHELGPKAWLTIGRVLLNSEKTDEAIRPLVRAVTTAHSNEIQGRAAIALTTVYLLKLKPDAASMVLMDYRDAIKKAPFDRIAAMLGTLARFRAASGVRKEGEGQRLISALAHLKPSDYENDSIRFLAGQAWAELGLADQMAALYQSQIASTSNSQIRDRMTYELGEWLRTTGSIKEALKVFETMDSGGDSLWQRRGRESKARIYMETGKLDECITMTRELLGNASGDEEKRRLLELLGKSYELQGKYSLAVQCFSGILPNVVLTTATEPSND